MPLPKQDFAFRAGRRQRGTRVRRAGGAEGAGQRDAEAGLLTKERFREVPPRRLRAGRFDRYDSCQWSAALAGLLGLDVQYAGRAAARPAGAVPVRAVHSGSLSMVTRTPCGAVAEEHGPSRLFHRGASTRIPVRPSSIHRRTAVGARRYHHAGSARRRCRSGRQRRGLRGCRVLRTDVPAPGRCARSPGHQATVERTAFATPRPRPRRGARCGNWTRRSPADAITDVDRASSPWRGLRQPIDDERGDQVTP